MQQDGFESTREHLWYLFVPCVFVSTRVLLDGSRKSDTALSNHDPRTAVQLRTALKRLKEIMEGKSQVFILILF